jgi:hypothetical protein
MVVMKNVHTKAVGKFLKKDHLEGQEEEGLKILKCIVK